MHKPVEILGVSWGKKTRQKLGQTPAGSGGYGVDSVNAL
jgi:hypothetical protein